MLISLQLQHIKNTTRTTRQYDSYVKEEFAKKIDKSIFPGDQGGPLMHVIAAKAVAFGEALQDDFKHYAQNIIDNANRLAEGLKKKDLLLYLKEQTIALC